MPPRGATDPTPASCFSSSCALVVSKGGFASTRNTTTVLSRASMPASRCWPTEVDTAATDDSMAHNLPGKWASHSRCSQTASWPTQRAARRSARQPEDNSPTLHELAQVFHQRRKCCDHGKSWRCEHGEHRRDVHYLVQHCQLASNHDVLTSTCRSRSTAGPKGRSHNNVS